MAATDVDIYIANGNNINVTGVRNANTGAYINNATVTANLYDRRGVVVQGPIDCAYIASSNGNYRGLIEDGTVLAEGGGLTLEVVIDAGADNIATFRRSARALFR